MESKYREINRLYYLKNREKIIERAKKNYKKNRTKILKNQKESYPKNKERKREYNERYYKKNKVRLCFVSKERLRNPGKYKVYLEYQRQYKRENGKYFKEYRQKNKEKINKQIRISRQKKRDNDVSYRIRNNIGSRICSAIKSKKTLKSNKTFKLIGCSIFFLKKYIEKQFKGEMKWANYGKIWHIDHRIPCAIFDLTKEAEQKKCFNYTNLRPLLVSENYSKGNRYSEPSLKYLIKFGGETNENNKATVL